MLQRYQRSEEELRRVAAEWLECQKRIDAYVDEQVRVRGVRGGACGVALAQPSLQDSAAGVQVTIRLSTPPVPGSC